ncbi:MAG TPA: hypothetical protein PK079_22340 [Leptospiraceae bacterium]|nr:hypothetical protein [Leptospiraceae bacterium]HMX30663.1 hypothetical protein [Leptospiraceae bacterium]HMY31363.1 hypothetical protein [Leptospiraceae bacterium]HMZ63600.1 hypothetical protein [Leptospiraceae bacterium]HNA06256.1 hypothetical protein [Leptospiraceae bacterium]
MNKKSNSTIDLLLKISNFSTIRFLFIFLILPFFLSAESIAELNKKGILALQKKDYKKAEEIFKKSLSISPNDAKANYNLACTYALMEEQCEPSENGNPLTLLEKAVLGDVYYKTKMLKDSDLKSLRNNIKFYKLAGLTKKQILTKIIWYGPKPGVANIDKMVFTDSGKFYYSVFNSSGEGNPGYTEYNGRYVWIKEDIQIQFDESPFDSKKKIFNVKLKENSIQIEGFDHELSDFEDRCSA